MDFRNIKDIDGLTKQLRKPEGEYGKRVGQVMAEKNSEVTAFTIECLDVQPTDHVLEIGFGPGEGIAQLVRITASGFVAGVDYSEEMLVMAKERNRKALMQECAELLLGDANKLPCDDESFAKVLAVNVFHFWKDPSIELAECFRVLRPGGRIAFFMAFPSAYIPGFKESGVFIPREPEEVEACLLHAGFTDARSKTKTIGEYKGFATIAEKA